MNRNNYIYDNEKMDDLLKENSAAMATLIKDIDKMMHDLIFNFNNGYQKTDAVGFTVETEDDDEEDSEGD